MKQKTAIFKTMEEALAYASKTHRKGITQLENLIYSKDVETPSHL